MIRNVFSLVTLLLAIAFLSLTLGCSNSPGAPKNNTGRFGLSAEASGSQGAIYSAVPLLDTSGNLVNAHGVGFLKVGSTYYMIGEQRSGKNDTYSGSSVNLEDSFTGVSLYHTTDFVSWTFDGTIITPISGTDVYPPYYGERPKILYNSSTGKYVVYIKMLQYTGTYNGHFAMLTSSSITGPYSYVGDLAGTSQPADFEVFTDTDGTAYFCNNGGMLYKLASNYLSIASTTKSGIQSGEGPSLYKAGSYYFWQSSQGTYWHCNDNSYSSSTSLSGTWTSYGYFSPSGTKTWESQDTAVVTVAGSSGTTYIYVGDRWVNGDLPASTLVMQPLTVSSGTESISTYYPVWKLNVSAGTWSSVTPSGTTVNDNTTGAGQNQFNYGSGWTSGSWSGCYNSDAHSASTSNTTATIAFNGTQILLYSAYNTSSGIMGVTLENSSGSALYPEVHVSLRYDCAAAGNYLVYASPVLSSGSYILKVRALGRKDPYSSGNTINIDRVLIIGSSNTPTPTPTGTPTPTPTPGGGIVSGNIYSLTSVNSGKNLDNYNHGTNGQWVGQYTAGTGTTQQWKITANGSYYTLVNQQSGLALDNGSTSTAGAHVMQWTANGGTSQNWQIVLVSGNTYTLKSQYSGQMLDNGNSTANGQTVIQSTATGGTTQQWTIQ
jgi:hypothetical protein